MKLGQFCGLVADTMGLRHSEFIAEAEVMLAEMELDDEKPDTDWEVRLPDTHATLSDAALLVFLVAASEHSALYTEYGQMAGYARRIGAIGDNLAVTMRAIQQGTSCQIDVSLGMETVTTIPEKLTGAMAKVLSGSKPVKLKAVEKG